MKGCVDMNSLEGNITAHIQLKRITGKNPIGENIEEWLDAYVVGGYLDLASGDSNYTNYRAKTIESTHLFLCDYFPMNVDVKDARMIIEGKIYDVKYIDDVMNLHQHYEMYLDFVG